MAEKERQQSGKEDRWPWKGGNWLFLEIIIIGSSRTTFEHLEMFYLISRHQY